MMTSCGWGGSHRDEGTSSRWLTMSDTSLPTSSLCGTQGRQTEGTSSPSSVCEPLTTGPAGDGVRDGSPLGDEGALRLPGEGTHQRGSRRRRQRPPSYRGCSASVKARPAVPGTVCTDRCASSHPIQAPEGGSGVRSR